MRSTGSSPCLFLLATMSALAAVPLMGCRDKFTEGKAEVACLARDLEGNTVAIRTALSVVADSARTILERKDQVSTGLFPGREYKFYQDTVYYNPVDDGNGAMFYTGFVPVREAQKARLLALEGIVPSLKGIVDAGPTKGLIAQAYLITGDSLLVFYPFSDLLSYIPPKRDMRTRGVWKKTAPDIDPARTPKWDPPYVDTTGKGYMVDVTCPVDVDGRMEAVGGVDITLNALNKDLASRADLKLVLVETRQAQILAMSAAAERFFSVGNVEAFKYLRMIEHAEAISDPVMPDNLILSKTSSAPMRSIWESIGRGEADFALPVGNRRYRARAEYLAETGWVLVLVE